MSAWFVRSVNSLMAAPISVRTFSGPRQPTHFSLPLQQGRSMKDSGRVLSTVPGENAQLSGSRDSALGCASARKCRLSRDSLVWRGVRRSVRGMPRGVLAVTVASMSVVLVLPFSALGADSGAGGLSTGWPRVSHLSDGSTVSVWKSGHVVERNRRGRILSESWCESYPVYERWVAFMGSFQIALKRGEIEVVARDVHYP